MEQKSTKVKEDPKIEIEIEKILEELPELLVKHAYEMIQVFPAEEVEKTQTIIKFYCYPQPETPATPSKLKGNPV